MKKNWEHIIDLHVILCMTSATLELKLELILFYVLIDKYKCGNFSWDILSTSDITNFLGHAKCLQVWVLFSISLNVQKIDFL